MSDMPNLLPAAIGVVVLLFFVAGGVLLWQETRTFHYRARIDSLLGGGPAQHESRIDLLGIVTSLLRRVGDRLRDTAFMSPKDVAEFEKMLSSAGMNARSTIGVMIGLKAVLPLALATLFYLLASAAGWTSLHLLLAVGMALPAGMMLPNFVMGTLQSRYRKSLENGIPDALDLIVICSEAGLGLETAVARVAAEISESNPSVGLELNLLDQEMRLMSDRRRAVAHFAERASVPSIKRVASTILQTIEYGTPLSGAFRTLSAEMRAERLVRMEEAASKLPAMLMMPMMLFILPCLFIVILGPAIIKISGLFGSMHH
jgi:tight adherence protein C